MPSFPVAVLRARVPLCKTFRATDKDSYPNALDFKSSTKSINSLDQFATLIRAAALEGACLLKGELDQELDWEPRKGHHLIDKPTFWVCFDIDYMPSIATIDDFLTKIGVTDVSYIRQWSGSYGVYGNFNLRAHLFFMLDEPCSPVILKLWLRQLNLQLFANDLVLTRADVALRWGLDVTTCQNDKLIYVAPPICHPSSLNQFQGERVTLVKKSVDVLTLPPDRLSVAQIQVLERTKIEELRKAKGMDPRGAKGYVMKEYKGQEYLSKPDQGTVTGVKEDPSGEFMRLNINGGDSWAYFHPKNDATFIYNFKGEPVYRTQELDPDYWYRTINAGKQAVARKHKGKLFLGFRDFRTSAFYNGTYDQDNDVLTISKASSGRDVKDFLEDNGQPPPNAIPVWDVVYDPHAPTLDLTNRRVNFFAPSQYMKDALTRQTHQPFPRIDALMRHVVGDACINHWYNWLAFVYQRRVAPGTAWVWHGTQGTGKGLIFNTILRAIFGIHNVTSKRMEELEDSFNGHLENSLICFVDEAQVSESGRSKVIMANLKNQITEPTISIRRMHTNAYTTINRVGWIFASNMPDAVIITSNDRRFNVATFQPNSLPQPSSQDIAAIEAELLDFTVFLRLFAVDEIAVREVLKNDDREQMIMISQPSADTLANHIKQGSLSELWDYLPTGDFTSTDHRLLDAYYAYKALMYDLVKTGRGKLTRDELYILFAYGVGNVPSQPSKLTSYLKHHGIAVGNLRMGTTITKGIQVTWRDMPEWFDDRRAEITQIEAPTLKVVK